MGSQSVVCETPKWVYLGSSSVPGCEKKGWLQKLLERSDYILILSQRATNENRVGISNN